jgi:hypothetical protein
MIIPFLSTPGSISMPKGTCHRRVPGFKLTQNPVACKAFRSRAVTLTPIYKSPQLALQPCEVNDAFFLHCIICAVSWKYDPQGPATTVDIQRRCRCRRDGSWVRDASRVDAAEVSFQPRVTGLLLQSLLHRGIETPVLHGRDLLAAELCQIASFTAYTQCMLRSLHALDPFEHRAFGVQDAVEVIVTWVSSVHSLCVGVAVLGFFLAIPHFLPVQPSAVSELGIRCGRGVLLDFVFESFSLA